MNPLGHSHLESFLSTLLFLEADISTDVVSLRVKVLPTRSKQSHNVSYHNPGMNTVYILSKKIRTVDQLKKIYSHVRKFCEACKIVLVTNISHSESVLK